MDKAEGWSQYIAGDCSNPAIRGWKPRCQPVQSLWILIVHTHFDGCCVRLCDIGCFLSVFSPFDRFLTARTTNMSHLCTGIEPKPNTYMYLVYMHIHTHIYVCVHTDTHTYTQKCVLILLHRTRALILRIWWRNVAWRRPLTSWSQAAVPEDWPLSFMQISGATGGTAELRDSGDILVILDLKRPKIYRNLN